MLVFRGSKRHILTKTRVWHQTSCQPFTKPPIVKQKSFPKIPTNHSMLEKNIANQHLSQLTVDSPDVTLTLSNFNRKSHRFSFLVTNVLVGPRRNALHRIICYTLRTGRGCVEVEFQEFDRINNAKKMLWKIHDVIIFTWWIMGYWYSQHDTKKWFAISMYHDNILHLFWKVPNSKSRQAIPLATRKLSLDHKSKQTKLTTVGIIAKNMKDHPLWWETCTETMFPNC